MHLSRQLGVIHRVPGKQPVQLGHCALGAEPVDRTGRPTATHSGDLSYLNLEFAERHSKDNRDEAIEVLVAVVAADLRIYV